MPQRFSRAARIGLAASILLAGLAGPPGGVRADTHPAHPPPPARPARPGGTAPAHDGPSGRKPEPPIRLKSEELHRAGVPRGWTFRIPAGDAEAGREIFIKLECHQCHAVGGERFPHVERGPKDIGPDLAGMGSHHPPEYFAESIVDPSRVIALEEGYAGPDGLSIMPSYDDLLTVRELVDLVAYLSSLRDPGAPATHHKHR